MVRNSRKPRRPRRSQNTTSALARLRTGIPVTIRTRSSDPPNLPISWDFSVRARINIIRINGNASSSLVNPEDPEVFGRALLITPLDNLNQLFDIIIPSNFMIQCAAVRLFGDLLESNTYNARNCEFALGKVTFYGPLENSDSITLSVDYGDGLPGFRGNDKSDKLKRAVVSTSPSRLQWWIWDSSPGVEAVVLGWNTLSNQVLNTTSAQQEFGCLDFTMHIRRSITTHNVGRRSRVNNVIYTSIKDAVENMKSMNMAH